MTAPACARSRCRASAGLDEFYGRNLAAAPRIEPEDVPLAQVYARHAVVENARGERYEARTWSEIDVVQWTARQPGARAWYVADDALREPVRERTVGEVVEAAASAGAPVERRHGATRVEVVAGITTTLGGISVDERARAADGLWAAGADVGGISTGGWSSALASALVLGRIAAEDAVGQGPTRSAGRRTPARPAGAGRPILVTVKLRSSTSTDSPGAGGSPSRSTSS